MRHSPYIYNNGDCECSEWLFDIWTGSAWECPCDGGYESEAEAREAAAAYVASV
jgi:hypothetical protein